MKMCELGEIDIGKVKAPERVSCWMEANILKSSTLRLLRVTLLSPCMFSRLFSVTDKVSRYFKFSSESLIEVKTFYPTLIPGLRIIIFFKLKNLLRALTSSMFLLFSVYFHIYWSQWSSRNVVCICSIFEAQSRRGCQKRFALGLGYLPKWSLQMSVSYCSRWKAV